MYRSTFLNKRRTRTLHWLVILNLALILMISVAGVTQAAGTVTGLVFRDYNADGIQNTDEPGVGGIAITVFGAAGTALNTTVSSQSLTALGQYSISWAGTDTRVRLEFSGLPSYLQSGAFGTGSGTSVQFVNAGGTANYGVNNPSQFCDNNPTLSTSCYVFGDQLNGPNNTLPAIIRFDYLSSGTPSNETTLATAEEVAATYGIAQQRRTDTLFAAAFVKRHVGLISINNPAGNPGMIYKIVGAAAPAPYITLAAGADPHTPINVTPLEPDYFDDLGAFDAVGRVGLGDIDLSEDENRLYVVNLSTKQLQIIDATGVTGTLLSSFTFPQPANCAAANTIPGALKVYDNLAYVGITCTGPTINDLRAYVYSFNGATFGGPVAEFALNYPRGYASTDYNAACPVFPAAAVYVATHCVPANWQPWTTTTASFFDGPYGGQKIYPQPWLLDIEIDEYGFLIANFADRMGHQTGNSTGNGTGPVESVSAGDMLRLAPSTYPVSSATWTLENNAGVGLGIVPGGGTTAGQNGQGPGGGEYYSGDAFTDAGLEIHNEIYLGGTALVYGTGEIVTAAFDPTSNIRSGGLVVTSNSTGQKNRGIEVFGQDETGTFGKAAGIGDIEVRCTSAPIEIGNYVWFDANQNGIQDANEQPLANITVELVDPITSAVIATAITDAQGRYIFSSNAAGSTGSFIYNVPLTVNTNYQVRIDTAQPNLFGYTTTASNAGGGANAVRDSNGVTSGNFAIANVTTGTAGQNDHTIDFGFFTPPYSLGNRIWFDDGRGGGTPNDGIQNGTEIGIDGVTVNLLDSLGNVIATTVTTAGGYYRFDNLAPGSYSVQIPASNFVTGSILNGLNSSADTADTANPNNNVDRQDNGIGTGTAANVNSNLITLGPGTTEPTNTTDLGPGDITLLPTGRSNLTVDFGFFGTPPTYSLGNRVWLDSNDSGTIDGGEVGIGGVAINLYPVTAGVPALTPIRTLTTDANGYYLFDNLPPGDYVVEIGASNFGAGAPLAGLRSSTPDELNPNADVDSNDNGIGTTPGTNGIRSGIVTLGPGVSEPTGETDLGPQGQGIAANDHSNLTIDFGFFGTPAPGSVPAPTRLDPAIVKQVDPAFALPGEDVRWTITVSNPHSVAVNNVTFVDDFPSQLEIINASADNTVGSLVVSGNTVTYSIVVINPGQAVNVRVLTRIRAGTPVPFIISNTVNLTNGLSGSSTSIIASASATLLSVGSLPATGFEPLWREPLLVGVSVLLLLFGVGAVRALQRRHDSP